MSRRRNRAIVALGAILAFGTTFGACAGGDEPSRPGSGDSTSGSGNEASPTTAKISMEQASQLADVLVLNKEAGNAAVTARYTSDEGVISLDGAVDWAGVQGMFDIAFPGEPNRLTPDRVAYAGSSVFQRFPGLANEFAAEGYPGVEWVVQPADPQTSALVRLFGLISSAAAEQRDNPTQLVARGVTSIGSRDINGVQASGFDMGSTTYWVGQDDGRLHRLEADLAGDPVVIDFSDWGESTVNLPQDDGLVEAGVMTEILNKANVTAPATTAAG